MKTIRVLVALLVLMLLFVAQGVAATTDSELVEKRTENAKFYPGEDGRLRGVFYAGPVHYQNTKGQWINIDLNAADMDRVANSDDNIKRFGILSSAPEGKSNAEVGTLEDERGNLRMFKAQYGYGVLRNKFGFLAPKTSKGHFIVALNDKERIAFTPENAQPVQGSKTANTVSYSDAWPGATLQYDVHTNLLTKKLVLSAPSVQTTYSFRVKGYGLTPRVNADGVLEFIDKGGQVKTRMVAPFLEDAKGVQESVDTDIAVNGNSARIVMNLDRNWLENPERAFPVVLDPTMNFNKNEGDTYIDQYGADNHYGTGSNAGEIRMGVYRSWLIKESRSWGLIKFDLRQLPTNTYIHSASLKLWCYSVTGDKVPDLRVHAVPFTPSAWDENTITWNNSGIKDVLNNLPQDPLADEMASVTGAWTKRLSPSTISNLINNPENVLLLWTYHPTAGYIRYFESKEGTTDPAQQPYLTIDFSYIPQVSNVQQTYAAVDDPDLMPLGFVDRLKPALQWSVSYPYHPAYSGTQTNYEADGIVQVATGGSTFSKPSIRTLNTVAQTQRHDVSMAPPDILPFKTYDVMVKSWATNQSYIPTDPNTYATVTAPSFATPLSYSTFDFSTGSLPSFEHWGWVALEANHVAPPARAINDRQFTIRYTTDTKALVRVEYWKTSDGSASPQVIDENTAGYKYRHEITLVGLDPGTSYGYRVLTHFAWDGASGVDPRQKSHTVVSADGEITTSTVAYSGIQASASSTITDIKMELRSIRLPLPWLAL